MKIVPNDEARDIFMIPAWLDKMVENNWLGDKTGQGFFKKIKPLPLKGRKKFYTLDLKTFEYKPRVKPKFANCRSGKANR